MKIHDPPPVAGGEMFLDRPRIDRLLEKALHSHVVTMVAGEGSGKTHAMTSFLRKDPRPVIWVQISERDNLGWRFWENYTGEIARLNPEAGKIFADIGFPESGRQFDRYLNLVKDEIVSHERYVIVFDDFHLLTNPAVLLHLERALAAPVSKNTIAFISRTEPAINTLNLLAKGLLFQITAEDLRFTREETDGYFRLHHILLEEEELERIYQKTEGWALALSLIRQGIQTDRAGGRSWDQVMLPIRKMEENIFSTMEAELQKFLVKLSLIEHWPRNLLERLESGGKHISAMENFSSVIRFDVYLHGFRIHHLFLDFLREKQEHLSWEEIREVCCKGAQWCMENNLPTDAAVNYERARDYGGLIRLINSLPRMLPRPMASFFLGTVDRLIALGEDEDDEDFLFLRLIIRSRLLMYLDRFDESAAECHAVIAQFEPQDPSPWRSRILSAAYNNLGTLSILSARYTRKYDFERWFERGCHYYLENPEPVQGQLSQSNLGSYVMQMACPAAPGEIDAFLDAYSAAVPYAATSMGGYLSGTDTLARAELAYYQEDLNRAEFFARQAIYQAREKKQYEVENRALFYLMRMGIHKGDLAGIQESERQMNSQLETGDYPNRYIIHDILMGRFYARLGLVEKIAPWLGVDQEEGELNSLFGGFDTLVKARCRIHQKDYQGALNILEEEQAKGRLGSFLLGFVEMAALEAMIRCQIGDRENAFRALKKAYDAASPHGLTMPFVEMREYMHSLGGILLKTYPKGSDCFGLPREWLETMRRAASAYAKKRSLVAAQYSGRDTAEFPDVSDWELEILSSLSQGRTGEEIAGDMKISPKMVKSAIRSLYAKLGAANRADAIRIATAKGLLKDPP
jgi:LuxR family maltose regulon positive regulatory protein